MKKLGALVLLALESRGLVVLGLAWVLLLGVIVLGLAILLGLGVLEFRSLLALEDCLVFRNSLVLVLVLVWSLFLSWGLFFGWRNCCLLCWSGRLWVQWSWCSGRGFGKASPGVS